MRYYFPFLVLLFFLSIVLFPGCGKPKLKNMRGLVKSVTIDDDTLKYMTVQAGGENDTIVFNIMQTRLNEGMMMPQDSVIVDFVEHNGKDTVTAYVVTVLPKPAKTIEIKSALGK